jgi:trimeric autotransporter adhesin
VFIVSSDWRARLGSFAAGLGFNRLSDDFSDVAEGAQASGEATAETARLRRLLDDLKAGDPNKEPAAQPEGPVVGPVAVGPVAVEPVSVEPVAVEPEVVEPAKARVEEKPRVEVAKVAASAPVLNGERKAETPMPDDVFLLIAEQRKAAEALLLQVAELEQRLRTEAHAAQATADYTAAKEKAEAAAILEQQANELAHAALGHHNAVLAERQEADKLAAATRADAEAAKAKVEELQDQLRDARRLSDQSLSALAPRENRAKELAANEAAAQRKATEAAASVTACQSARAQAEKDAEAAQKRAETLTREIAELSARIAHQAAEVQRSREAIVTAR